MPEMQEAIYFASICPIKFLLNCSAHLVLNSNFSETLLIMKNFYYLFVFDLAQGISKI